MYNIHSALKHCTCCSTATRTAVQFLQTDRKKKVLSSNLYKNTVTSTTCGSVLRLQKHSLCVCFYNVVVDVVLFCRRSLALLCKLLLHASDQTLVPEKEKQDVLFIYI